MREAMLYERLEELRVRCNLCAHRCLIKNNKRGICGVRQNQEGTLQSLVYGRAIARHVDPIEKKPLFHFQPGTRSYSIATVGCNFRCRFCQNADISQMPRDFNRIIGEDFLPADVVAAARRSGCSSVSYTYTEPTIFFEYAYDTARLAQAAGLKNVFVSNGYMTPEALEVIQPYLDAANVDLKAFSEKFYQEQCGGKLAPVLESLNKIKDMGIWLEVTTLVIPQLNDSEKELRNIARFIRSLGPETPWHVSRFHPTYNLTDRASTPVAALQRAREIGLQEGLHYVYTGNIPGDEGENTFCHACGQLLIDRFGFTTARYNIKHGLCPWCETQVAGVEM
ncbi:MAG: AmmeMemoRadiSam system radical SAM enzyme [Deltaproteobacteria bacterium]|nr:AmmeMemoRadiSam system radical SAM enzyme [Deltaproteobacteria bacterium]MBW2070973.1 AmmeMemoRadiSam system radical SAM enzyme [Deltaproteobacteria bacterium]